MQQVKSVPLPVLLVALPAPAAPLPFPPSSSSPPPRPRPPPAALLHAQPASTMATPSQIFLRLMSLSPREPCSRPKTGRLGRGRIFFLCYTPAAVDCLGDDTVVALVEG